MKKIITDFFAALFAIILFIVILTIILITIPICIIAAPFVYLFVWLFGGYKDDYN